MSIFLYHPFQENALETPLIERSNFSIEQSDDSQKKNLETIYKPQSKINQILFGLSKQKCQRQVYLNGLVEPLNYQTNTIKNSKYNVFTFLPLVMYEQFHQFINLFYLGLTITQLIEIFKVGKILFLLFIIILIGFLLDYLGPLLLVVGISTLKELYDDIKRHKRDKELNNYKYKICDKTGEIEVESGELRVGMIVQIKANERLPADMIVLYADDEQGNVFIRTDQLDGETDWKLRKAIKICQTFIAEGGNINEFLKWNSKAICGEPIENIYSFTGVFIDDKNGIIQKESLSLENVMWQNTVLATGSIWGIVIQCGRETRMAMNGRDPKAKFGILDSEVNHMAILLFFMMAFLSLVVTAFSNTPLNFTDLAIMYTRYLILLSNIIPISMRVNLEFAKLKYSHHINIDPRIQGTIVRNSNIPESLGRIQYLLTDKTGTLTQNDMIFKKISLEQSTFTEDDIVEMSKMMNEQLLISSCPLEDVSALFNLSSISPKKTQKLRREREAIYRDLISALALCHNVTPINNDDGTRSFQASSPDEIALVKIAESVGLKLERRDLLNIYLTDSTGAKQQYEVLNNFPFSSDTKRMGIVVRNVQYDRYIFYLKGADSIMKQFIPEVQRGFIDEECENLAREGLRTLVITQKLLRKEEYQRWNRQFIRANEQLDNREQEVRKAIAYLESNMEFLGITGVEDKLQEDVYQTLESIRNAGINVWMLTGDKVETAICIAISSGIKPADQDMVIIKEITNEISLRNQLNQFDAVSFNKVLVIDGTSLGTALQYHEELFITIATKAPAVVCCRCSPTQKAQVTECIKKYTKKVTACVGDGGNDVGMIQMGDVGIGIEGKEGKQAALASDFSIQKFKCLTELLLWHGRLSYKRSAQLSQFVVYRGLIISIIQVLFMFIFYYLSISIFSGYLLFGYSTIYTTLPVFSIIFDEDVDINIALQYPPLYRSLQKGRDLCSKTFLTWVWKATYQVFIIILSILIIIIYYILNQSIIMTIQHNKQGTVIMILSIYLFKNIFIELETVAFTALIFTQYALTLTELNSIHIVMIISNILSAVVYIGTIYLLPQQLMVSAMDAQFFGYLFLIVLVSWGPIFIVKLILQRMDPSDFEKIMAQVKRARINTIIFN